MKNKLCSKTDGFHLQTDDQILLLQNCWSELIALSLCWRSIETPGQISISATHHITAEWATHLGFQEVVVRMLAITDYFRALYLDQYEYVALKVLLLITPGKWVTRLPDWGQTGAKWD